MSEAQRATAWIDLGAIRHNAGVLVAAAAPAELMAVVKAGGYGHGAVPVARAALDGGARRLAVATVEEAEELRAAGLDVPILVMGPLVGGEVARALAAGAEFAVWTPEMCTAAAAASPPDRPARVHIGLDTGMGRLGVRAEGVTAVADAAARPGIEVVGIMTHFATADVLEGDESGFFAEQLLRFRASSMPLRDRFPRARLHAANSAATLRGQGAAFDVVRCGIALYGCNPFGDHPSAHSLRPAMRWSSYVAVVKWLNSRESAGYGRTWRAARGTTIAVVPVGYADGYARNLSNRGQALVGGRRVPVVGAISMDQLTVDLGPEARDAVGDEVVLLGTQGSEEITAEEMAAGEARPCRIGISGHSTRHGCVSRSLRWTGVDGWWGADCAMPSSGVGWSTSTSPSTATPVRPHARWPRHTGRAGSGCRRASAPGACTAGASPSPSTSRPCRAGAWRRTSPVGTSPSTRSRCRWRPVRG